MEDRPSFVSIIIVTHNSQGDIIDCIDSILKQDYQDFEIIVVDNVSKDNTVEVVERNFAGNPVVKVVRNSENDGYAGGNNLGFCHSKGEMIVILNPDLIVDRVWLRELLNAYERHSNAGIVCSNILLYDKPEVINACGNDVHLAGFVFSRLYMKNACECKEEAVAAPSGASMIFSRKSLPSIGRTEPFDDERFFMEYSDIDLAIDFLAHDFQCYVAPSSKVLHKYVFKMDPRRFVVLEKGRYHLLGHFTKKMLFRMFPALLLAELIVWTFAFRYGRSMMSAKIEVQAWLLFNGGKTFRKNNSTNKDLKILRKMTPSVIIYHNIVGDDRKGAFLASAQRSSDRLYRFVRDSILGS